MTEDSFPCPVFDEDAEMPDQEFQELFFTLIHEAGLTPEELKAWWRLKEGAEN